MYPGLFWTKFLSLKIQSEKAERINPVTNRHLWTSKRKNQSQWNSIYGWVYTNIPFFSMPNCNNDSMRRTTSWITFRPLLLNGPFPRRISGVDWDCPFWDSWSILECRIRLKKVFIWAWLGNFPALRAVRMSVSLLKGSSGVNSGIWHWERWCFLGNKYSWSSSSSSSRLEEKHEKQVVIMSVKGEEEEGGGTILFLWR